MIALRAARRSVRFEITKEGVESEQVGLTGCLSAALSASAA